MKKMYLLFKLSIISLLLFCSDTFAGIPSWTRVDYTNSTTFYGVVGINNPWEQTFTYKPVEGDYIGAFVGTECRMIAKIRKYNDQLFVSSVIQGGNVCVGDPGCTAGGSEVVTFRLWSTATNTEYANIKGDTISNPGGGLNNSTPYVIGRERPVTEVRLTSSFRNTTLVNVIAPITCNAISSASAYQWKFITATGNITTFETTSNSVIPGMAALNFDVKYLVSISAKINGNWLKYGSVDTFKTPIAPTTQLSASYRGIILTSDKENFQAQYVTGATGYEFVFTDIKTGTIVTRMNKNHRLNAYNVKGLTMGTKYNVKIRPVFYKSIGNYGETFSITTPSSLALTCLKEEFRGITVSHTHTQILRGYQVQFATDYEWEFREIGGTQVLTTLAYKTTNAIAINMVKGYKLESSYSVRIRPISGSFKGQYGQAFTIFTSKSMTKSETETLAETEASIALDEVIVTNTQEQNIILYPVPAETSITIEAPSVDGGYSIKITSLSGLSIKEFTMNSTSETINISDLQPGIYFVKLSAGSQQVKELEFIKK